MSPGQGALGVFVLCVLTNSVTDIAAPTGCGRQGPGALHSLGVCGGLGPIESLVFPWLFSSESPFGVSSLVLATSALNLL